MMTNSISLRNVLAQACFVVSALGLVPVAIAEESASTPTAPVAPAAQPQTGNETPITPSQDAASVEDVQTDAQQTLAQPEVGEATSSLLYWQRSGAIGSTTPRPIPGPIANRSYERYLKSFEHPIPEFFNSTVKTKSSN